MESKIQLKKCEVVLANLNLNSPLDNAKATTDDNSIRKSCRSRNKPNKYGEFFEESPRKRRLFEVESEDEDSFCENEEGAASHKKPSALFSHDDVGGQDMFKFKSRHTKNDLHNIVQTALCNSPKDSPLRTPRKSILSGIKGSPFNKAAESTPKRVNNILKKKIIKKLESESEDSDFSGSSSDYVPEGKSDESESSQSSDAEDNGSDSEGSVASKQSNAKVQIKRNRDVKTKTKESEYIVKPDNYFMMHSSKKILTSDHTLERLKNFNANDNMDLQQQIHLSDEHKKCIKKLMRSYEQLFNRWLYVLSENFNLVLYGVGSKKSILQKFQQQKLGNFPCIVVNGFFPSLTLRSILESIVVDLLEHSNVPTNIGDIVNVIETGLEDSGTDLFLIIHNIDGVMLRNAKTQSVLASISQIKRVHTIATIDHINAPLLWDHSKLSKFKFSWWDVTTFLPYIEETSYENSLLSSRACALQLNSLRSVHQSLTSNAKGIFSIIVNYQLENNKQSHYQGLPFRDLYSKSREQFLVSSDIALRAQLTEFFDHKLVKMKRTADGSENLVIPMDNSLLQQFLEQNS